MVIPLFTGTQGQNLVLGHVLSDSREDYLCRDANLKDIEIKETTNFASVTKKNLLSKSSADLTTNILQICLYYHLRSTVKREHFFVEVYFSNKTVSQTTVSTGPMKMFRLDHETTNVCHNGARFGHV